MIINSVIINKLFGVFTHRIDFNNNDGITIIIGENGLGKTVILEMIESFFKGNFFYFTNVEFESLQFYFNDDTEWILAQEKNDRKFPSLLLTQKKDNKVQFNSIQLLDFDKRKTRSIESRIRRYYPELKQIGPRHWFNRRTGEELDIDDLPQRAKYYAQGELFFDSDESEKPKWFLQKYENIDISLIETQRLFSRNQSNNEETHRKTVEKYSYELSQLIKSFLTQSTELSSKLDRTYPNRLIERLKEPSDLSKDDLLKELESLESKRKVLDAVGLIEIEKESTFLNIENPENVIIDVLKLYVEDSFEKLEIFDNVSTKIGILLNIINKRFKHKKLKIDKDKGFVFHSTVKRNIQNESEIIPVGKLSSGEQNELVLFYFLLFKTKNNSVILIDEPEVSLHISWQVSFIEDLKEIAKLNNLDVIIATHSPDIIDENWDLKVELVGVE